MSCLSAHKDTLFMENSEWEVGDLSIKKELSIYYGDLYSRCFVSLLLKRRRLFHCLTLIVPNVLLSLLSPFVFVLPVQGGEKMSFTLALLPAFAVNLSVLVTAMPASSLNASYLIIYLACLILVTTLSVITAACIQKYYHKNGAVTPKVKVIIVSLGRLFCFKNVPNDISKTRNTGNHAFENRNTDNPYHTCQGQKEGRVYVLVDQKEDKNPKEIVPERSPKVPSECGKREDRDEFGRASKEVQEHSDLLWEDATVILDFVFFRVFLFVIVAMVAVLMVILFVGQ